MAQYNAIKAAVNAYIKANGRKEITGQILNSVLNATIDSLGRFFQFAGEARPDTDPGTPDQNVTYLAGVPGTYTNFGGLVVDQEEIALLMWDGEWHKHTMLIGIREVTASVDNQVGTPSVDVNYANGVLDLEFHNLKGQQGNQGDAAGFGSVSADISGDVGTPGVSVEASGTNTAKNFVFHFTNLRGDPGVESVNVSVDGNTGVPYATASLSGGVLTLAFHNMKGQKGDTGSSVSYPFTLVNDTETDDATQALSAAMGKYLQDQVTQLEAKVTDRVTSVNDADYAIRAVTSSSSLVDNPSGTRVRIVFPVKAGDVIKLSTNYLSSFGMTYSGISAGIWNSPGNAVYAGTTGQLQTLISGYSTTPFQGVANQDGYLGVSFTNGNTAISDALFAQMLASLSVFVGGQVSDEIHNIEIVNDNQDAEITGVKADVYADPLQYNTTTDNIAVTAYSDKTSGPLEDTKQVMPAGAKLTKVKMFSTGSTNSAGQTHLIIYDENRTKVGDYVLGNIGTTDTEFDVSAHNIIIREGYHYAFDRMGNKYTTAIPDGRFKVASTGANATSKYFYGWTFSYEVTQTKVDELKADYPELFNRKVVVDNPLYDVVYSGYNNGNALEDKWQDLPVGAKITKVHLGSTGSSGGNPSYLYIYDSNLSQVGERIKLGTIGTTKTTFDISALNIIVQEGYHYCIQYFPRISAGNNINSGRYFAPATQTNPLSTYQVGFSFSYEYERTGADTIPETSLKGKYGSFIGDSICEGAGYKGGYALLVARKYGMKPPQNLGSSGAIIATNESENRVYINTMVSKVDPNADFVIIQGGSNDASISTPMGAITEGFTAELDVTTYYGAFENLCKTLVTQCAGKKIGYIARHRNSPTDKYSYTWLPKETNYYDPAIAVCQKWGVPILDLNRTCPPLGCIASLREAYTQNGDGSHPNEDGYNKYYVDRIAAWMQTL